MGQRLLIVDNDRRFLREQQASLEAAFEVEYAHGTEGVIPLLEGGNFAAVLISVEVSENKGYALCSGLRKNPKLSGFKVALISSKATEEEYARHQSLKGKADLYLLKPISPGALVEALAPLVPPRVVDADNPLGDLGGVDLGEEWLESLKAELDEEIPLAVPPPAPAAMAKSSAPFSMPSLLKGVAAAVPVEANAGRVELLQARVEDLEKKLQSQADLLAQKDQELDEAHQNCQSVTRNLDAAEVQRSQAETGLASLQEALVRSEAQKDQLQERLDAQTSRQAEEILAAVRERDEAQEQCVIANGRIEELQEDVARIRQEHAVLETLRQEWDDQQVESQRLRDEAAQVQAQFQELQGVVESLRESLAQVEGERDAAQSSAEGQRSQEARLQSRIGELEVELDRMKEAEQSASQRLVQAEQESSNAGAERARFREIEDQQATRIQELQDRMEGHAAELALKDGEIEILKADVSGLEATLRGQRRELAEHCSRLASLGGEHDQLQKLKDELEAQLRPMEARLAEGEDALSRERERLQEVEAQAAQLQRDLDGRDAAIAGLRQEMAGLMEAHELRQQEAAAVLEERNAQVADLERELEAQRGRIGELERGKQELEGHLAERTARMDALTEAIGDLETTLRRASDLTRPF